MTKLQPKTSTTGPHLRAIISGLQHDLNLHHWRIEFADAKPQDEHSMVEIRTIRPRMVARIYCSDAFYQLDHNAQRERLRHEVLHLVLDPIWEEVDFQLLHGNSDRYKEYRARFVRQLEKVVEHLARAPAFAAESMI